MADKIKKPAKCDDRCRYALSDDCSCECGGTQHGAGIGNMDDPKWAAKSQRLSLTRKAYRKHLNAEVKGSGTKLYRKDRENFNKQYDQWRAAQEAKA